MQDCDSGGMQKIHSVPWAYLILEPAASGCPPLKSLSSRAGNRVVGWEYLTVSQVIPYREKLAEHSESGPGAIAGSYEAHLFLSISLQGHSVTSKTKQYLKTRRG